MVSAGGAWERQVILARAPRRLQLRMILKTMGLELFTITQASHLATEPPALTVAFGGAAQQRHPTRSRLHCQTGEAQQSPRAPAAHRLPLRHARPLCRRRVQ